MLGRFQRRVKTHGNFGLLPLIFPYYSRGSLAYGVSREMPAPPCRRKRPVPTAIYTGDGGEISRLGPDTLRLSVHATTIAI